MIDDGWRRFLLVLFQGHAKGRKNTLKTQNCIHLLNYLTCVIVCLVDYKGWFNCYYFLFNIIIALCSGVENFDVYLGPLYFDFAFKNLPSKTLVRPCFIFHVPLDRCTNSNRPIVHINASI